MRDDIRVGSRVRVTLHGRRVAAWVVETGVTPPPGVTPQPLAAWSGLGPPPSVVSLAEWAAWRWAGPMSSFLGTASPPRVVRALPLGRTYRQIPLRSGPDAGIAVDVRTAGAPVADAPVSPPVAGESARIVDEALRSSRTVVRLAPALDAALIVEEVVRRLGSVLVLAPTHLRVDHLVRRLARSGVPATVLPDGWAEAAAGSPVVVGTRIAAWAPIAKLSGVVVLDAHDEAYREERSPTWSAVDVVTERARRDGVPCLLVTPCPTVSLLEGSSVVTTSRMAERRGWPPVDVVDRRDDDPRTGLFSERLSQVLHSVLPEGRAVCVLNRTGRARLLACASCGSLAGCVVCGGAMEQREAGGVLRCRRCGSERPVVCAVCDSTRMKLLRVGVSRVREELSALMGIEAVEITAAGTTKAETEPTAGQTDADTPRLADAHLVVGTEAALHRVTRADVVAFLDFDQHLLAPRFAAGEEALALLARAARVVGGRDGNGRLLVQTRLPDHEVLTAALHADPSELARSERGLRRMLQLPPFGALASIGGPAAAELTASLEGIEGLTLSSSGPASPVSTPSDPALPTAVLPSSAPKQWLVKAPDHRTLCDALASVPRPTGRLRVEVDPTAV